MITATLYVPDGDGAVLTIDQDGVPATFRVGHDDGAGPLPAANAVLGRHGWRPVGGWVQEAGGITGDLWSVAVERTAGEAR